MKGLRNKVILSGIVLMFAFIATIGTTYAWFTVSTSAEVQNINLQVAASQNLLIVPSDYTTPSNDTLEALRNADYYPTSLITMAQLEAKGYFDTPWRLKPATIWGGSSTATAIGLDIITNMETVMAGTGSTTPTYDDATPNDDSGEYIVLKFWLLSQAGVDQNLYVNDLTITSDLGNSTAQSYITEAVRVAFTFDDSTITIPDYTPQTLSSTFIYGHDADSTYAIPTQGTSVTLGTAPTAPSIVAPVAGNTGTLFTLKPNIPTLVTVVIFVEGWDSDANNDVILASFDISFGFIIENAA